MYFIVLVLMWIRPQQPQEHLYSVLPMNTTFSVCISLPINLTNETVKGAIVCSKHVSSTNKRALFKDPKTERFKRTLIYFDMDCLKITI